MWRSGEISTPDKGCNQGAIDLADALIVAYQRLEQIHALAERAHVELADHHLAELRETLEEIKELSGESD